MLSGTAPRLAGRLSVLVLAVAAALIVTTDAAPAQADGVRDAQLWVLNAINAPAAWQVTEGRGVTVAVIDSGVNAGASDLTGSVIAGPDLTGVGTPVSNPNWGMHGTWMASLIAGHGHDGGGSGIIGVAPMAHVLSIRVITNSKDPGYASYESQPQVRHQRELGAAIMYAVSHGADVISMSLGSGAPSLTVRSALQDALNHDIVVVASSGNSGDQSGAKQQGQAPYSFPADYPGVLGIAAVGRNGAPADFSSDNLSVQAAAPGVDVPAQGKDGGYWLVSGTSPACALTAGVAALIRSAYPALTPPLVRKAITTTTSNRPVGGYDDEVGFGTVNAAAAVAAAARLAGQGMTGPGSRRTGLGKASVMTTAVSADGYFGGGPGAVSPPPVTPRGLRQLVIFAVLAAGCLAMIVIAASRLVAMRRPVSPLGGPHGLGPDEPPPRDGWRPRRVSEDGDHRTAAPRHPWSAAPPGRHTVPRDQRGTPGGGE